MVQHLAAGKQTYHLSVHLPLDESFGSCLMPSRADVNVDCCDLDQLIRQHCSSKLMSSATLSTTSATEVEFLDRISDVGWLDSQVVSVLDSGAEGPGFKLQPQCCGVTVLGKPFALIVPLFTKQ